MKFFEGLRGAQTRHHTSGVDLPLWTHPPFAVLPTLGVGHDRRRFLVACCLIATVESQGCVSKCDVLNALRRMDMTAAEAKSRLLTVCVILVVVALTLSCST